MNASELLPYIFNGIEGEFAVFADDTETLYSTANLPQILPAGAVLELMIVGTKEAVGVPVDAAEMATFRLVKGDKVVNVALFDAPIHVDLIPEFVETFDIPVGDGWVSEIVTDTFYTFDEVFGASGGVTETDIKEDGHAETEETAADAGGGDGAEAEHGAGGAPEGGGECGEELERALEGASGPFGDAHASQAEVRGSTDQGAAGAEEDRPAGSDPEPAAAPVATLNDADLLGPEDVPELDALLQKPATLLLGEMWGARDRRNTQDGDWSPVEMSWLQWIIGGEGSKNAAAWGFSRHPVGKEKAGASIVLGSSIGKARKAKAMEHMYAMGLDIDSGAKLDDVLARIEKLGLFCLVYTSHSHGKRGLQLKRDDVLRKLQIKNDPDLAQIKTFLKEHDKNRYEESFIDAVTIANAKKQVKDGVVIELNTPPLEKFRLIFPLEERVKIIDLAQTHEAALSVWEDKITGLAVEHLGFHFDTSCTDPSRLFYTARHPKEAEDWYCAVVRGVPLRFEDVPAYKKSAYTAKREKLNAFEMAGGDIGGDRPAMALTPSGQSLNDWHTKYKSRFLIANLLEDYCADRIRVAGGEAEGHVHTECPFEGEHTSEGGTGTMAVNCIDSPNEYWTWFCHHDSCQGRHKLAFLEEALRQEWFEEGLLFDADSGYLLDAGEEEEDEPEEEPETAEAPKTPVDLAREFNEDSTLGEIEVFIKKVWKMDVDLSVRANVTAALAKCTNLGKRVLNNVWADLDKEQRRKEMDRAKATAKEADGAAKVNKWDFAELCQYGHRRIHDTNLKTPRVFHYMENLCVIRENSEGHARMKFLDKDGFAHHLNNVARYVRVTGDDDAEVATGVAAPHDVVSYLFSADYGTYPELRGVVTTPIFTAKGSLLTEPGYDYDSRLFYHPDQATFVPKVSDEPTEEEVAEAKRLLIEEILADFPLGALTRQEIVEQALHGEGVAAVSNMLALMILPFMRELVDGPTPGHLLVKPAPGTGASLLTDVFSIIATGRVTPALAMPTNKDEMSKTLTSVLANGQNIVFFDNINHSVDSGELASAMTAPTYQARLLGKSQTIEVDVRCSWVFTGNNVTLSSELVRRLIMIDLDARLANPELRAGWRHADIRGWATENRGRLVWACLTLIQNFVALGMPEQTDTVLASYENWSRVVGGVLKAAGIDKFLSNRDALKAKADDNEDDEFMVFLEMWWDQFGSNPVYSKGTQKEPGLIEMAVAEDLSLPVRKGKTVDGDMTYDSRGFGDFLSKNRGRVFKLEDGAEVTMDKAGGKRTKNGYKWQIVATKRPQGNVAI